MECMESNNGNNLFNYFHSYNATRIVPNDFSILTPITQSSSLQARTEPSSQRAIFLNMFKRQ